MRLIILLALLTTFLYGQEHADFTSLLKKYVNEGRVNYKDLKDDPLLDTYLKKLENTNPDSILDKNEQLAFWINVYNAYTLKIIVDNYPVESINDLHTGGLIIGTILKRTIWDKDFVIVNNERLTLNHVEHKIIRPEFRDPRAHFALVCASKSCPPLRPEAYDGQILDQQLNDQGRIFLNNPEKNYFDQEEQKAYLSKIFDWFDEDFGRNDEEILLFVSKFVDPEIARQIRSDPQEWDIKHLKYDWSLNE